LCYAPFTNMYFNIHGDTAPCWLGFTLPESYPGKSIKEIWNCDSFNEFRKNIKNLTLEQTCGTCLENLNNGNYVSVLAKAYDHLGKPATYPKMMELELDNTCNLECIMCNGTLSSSIRKNREKKPPLKIPYDDAFIEQLNEFIPHLQELRLNGGEPFLSKRYQQIVENVAKLNPGLELVVATNGTVLNNDIKALMEKVRFDINISIDSLQKDNYEKIRVNAAFEKTMQNFNYFLNYCRRKKTKLCVLVNPMRENWWEMADFIRFGNKHNIPIWFNTVRYPRQHALWPLPAKQLQHIYDTLSAENIKPNMLKRESFHNVKIFKNLLNNQIYQWLSASEQEQNDVIEDKAKYANPEAFFYEQIEKHLEKIVASKVDVENKMQTTRNTVERVLNSLTETTISREDFFNLANTMPPSMIYKVLMSKSDSELIKLVTTYGK
jgi:molybdenum cofactor biosynthesis enzyme MoaA